MTMPNIEIPEALRDMTEQSVKQMQNVCSEMKSASEQGTDVLEKAVDSASKAMMSLQAQSMEAVKANLSNGFAFMQNLLNVKSPSDLVEVCTSFTRQQMDMAMAQSKNMQDISAKAAEEVSKPAQEGVRVVINRVSNNMNKVA